MPVTGSYCVWCELTMLQANGGKIYKAIQTNAIILCEIKAAVSAQMNIWKDQDSWNLPAPLDR